MIDNHCAFARLEQEVNVARSPLPVVVDGQKGCLDQDRFRLTYVPGGSWGQPFGQPLTYDFFYEVAFPDRCFPAPKHRFRIREGARSFTLIREIAGHDETAIVGTPFPKKSFREERNKGQVKYRGSEARTVRQGAKGSAVGSAVDL
jgi:hypothetical protein